MVFSPPSNEEDEEDEGLKSFEKKSILFMKHRRTSQNSKTLYCHMAPLLQESRNKKKSHGAKLYRV